MENNADWVEDVRRWYFNSSRVAATAPAVKPVRRLPESDANAVGYEAAHPALQASQWAAPPSSGFGALS